MIMELMKTFVHFEYINYEFLFRQKMSWFKKLYSSQETKVVYGKLKSESKDDNKKEYAEEQEAVTVGEFKIDESQESSSSSTQSRCFSWSGLSRQFSTQKRKLSDDENEDEEDEKLWSYFCSTQETKKEDETPFSSQTSNISMQTISSQPINIPTQTAVDKDGNKNDDGDDDDEGKIAFYVKVGKRKKFKYF